MIARGIVVWVIYAALEHGAVNDTGTPLVAAGNDSYNVPAREPVVVTHADDDMQRSHGLTTSSCQ